MGWVLPYLVIMVLHGCPHLGEFDVGSVDAEIGWECPVVLLLDL